MSYSSHGECVSVGVRAHVLFGRLLSHDDYMRFLSSDTVPELVKKLKTTSYAKALEKAPSEPHRREVEALIKADLLDEARSMIAQLSAPRDQFFRAWVRRYEADNLKSIFRGIASGRLNREEMRQRLFIIRSSTVAYDELLETRSFDEAEKVLASSRYGKVLSEPLRKLAAGETKTLFSLEMAIDGFIELSLARALKKLSSFEQKMLSPILGLRVDLYNLYMLYRSAAFYSMSPEEALNRLLPVRNRVGIDFLLNALRASTPDEALDMIRANYPEYARVLTDQSEQGDTQLVLDRNIRRFLFIEARRLFAAGSPGFHTAMSYFMMKEAEAADIIRVIECVRYGYDRRHALRYMVMPFAAGGER